MPLRLHLPALPACALVALAGFQAPAFAADPEQPSLGRAGDFSLKAPEIEDEASSSVAGWYMRLDGGSSHVGDGEARFGPIMRTYAGGPGWSAGGGIGYRFLPELRADVTADYVSHNKLHEAVYLGNVYWDFATWGRATPYVGAGLGTGLVSLSTRATVAMIPGLDRDDWQPVWALMAGVSWAVTPNLSFTTGYRYLNFGAPSFDSPMTGLSLKLSGIAEQQFRIGIRYAFK